MLRSTCKFSSILSAANKSLQQPVRGLRAKTGKRFEVNQAFESGIKTKIGPMEVGQLACAGGATLAMGGLCYYGLGLSNRQGIIDNAVLWPAHVKQRISSTYLHLGGALATAGASAAAIYRTPTGQRFIAWSAQRPLMSFGVVLASLLGSGTVMRSLPYDQPFAAKYGAWVVHSGVLGLVMAPIGALGGALAIRAAWYTAGIVGGLSAIAVCAPSDQFLRWGGPLGIGLGGVFAASLGSAFLPPTSALGLGLYSISLYGGLLLFSGFLMYDTQKVIRRAENHYEGPPQWNGQQYVATSRYDPINASAHLVMDVVNIFVRMVQILAMGGGRRR